MVGGDEHWHEANFSLPLPRIDALLLGFCFRVKAIVRMLAGGAQNGARFRVVASPRCRSGSYQRATSSASSQAIPAIGC
jgi:hypothetical protein